MIQSIASIATQMQQEAVQAEAGARVSKMVLDSSRAQGDALLDMIAMQKEVQTHLGSNINTWA